MKKGRAIFPGSFDPVTLGHVDIIRRMSGLFTEVTVLVADSLKKNYFFTKDERVNLVRNSVADFSNVKVDQFRGLTINYAMQHKFDVIIRSLRGTNDWDVEATMAQANKKLAPNIETLFVMTQPEFAHISSTLVKEIAANSGSLTQFVSPEIAKAILAKL
jgi:pantetheine-phosphate adenylyltransferase